MQGMKERVIWRLSKGPQTGTQLAEIFGVTTGRMNSLMGSVLRFNSVVNVEASDWFNLPEGGRDRTYTLTRSAKVVTPQGKSPLYSRKTIGIANDETRRINTEKAQRRARLIKAGLWIPEFD